jgi:hypothetical protein
VSTQSFAASSKVKAPVNSVENGFSCIACSTPFGFDDWLG